MSYYKRRRAIVKAFDLHFAHPAKILDVATLDQLEACQDDSARRLLLDKGERFKEGEDTGLTFRRFLINGKTEADWMEAFARSETVLMLPHRNLPPKKPVISVPMIDYRHYRGDPRVWRMVKLAETLSRRVG